MQIQKGISFFNIGGGDFLPLTGGTMTGAITLAVGSANGLIFGDGDTVLYENGDDDLRLNIGGVRNLVFQTGLFRGQNSDDFQIMTQTTATATVPIFLPAAGYTGYGLGGDPASGYISLIADSTNAISVTSTAMSLYGAVVDYGVNDSGGAGYKVLRVPN